MSGDQSLEFTFSPFHRNHDHQLEHWKLKPSLRKLLLLLGFVLRSRLRDIVNYLI